MSEFFSRTIRQSDELRKKTLSVVPKLTILRFLALTRFQFILLAASFLFLSVLTMHFRRDLDSTLITEKLEQSTFNYS